MLLPTDESNKIMKKIDKLWTEKRKLLRSKTDNSEDYDEKYTKIKFNFNDGLSLNKTLQLPNIIIVVRAVFHENNKYYPQSFS